MEKINYIKRHFSNIKEKSEPIKKDTLFKMLQYNCLGKFEEDLYDAVEIIPRLIVDYKGVYIGSKQQILNKRISLKKRIKKLATLAEIYEQKYIRSLEKNLT